MYTHKRTGAIDTISGTLPLIAENHSAFLNAFEGCFKQGQPRIVVDLSQVPLIDSVGLETILDLRDQCQQRGGAIVLARPNALCRDILRINGMEHEVSIFEDTVTAMGNFSK
jgi:anti-anti-sigma factor